MQIRLRISSCGDIASLRNAEELTKSTERNAKASDLAMKYCLVGGAVLAIAGLVTGF
ncbi:hypothetical protein [Thermoleptolyngbya sp. C42_A2020_037]|uniref:hypothetical protein n=1 Tax=Thermoleptolyngbya sp. C42_A2020_037 TaxID=2747799 RepID=UPI0019DBC77D|nr:hypothetical protein [Thermoleptolyngbya sp. C42_A2020_037]MBF2085930.1 hypothetical protein [Thermoleptolyngbya sp. C42_A2020_037]